jgi:hypothetical protein
VAADLKRQLRSVRVSDVDRLAVVDFDDRYPTAVDESPVERTVVDGQPPALVEPQQQVSARDQGVGDPHIGAQIAPDHHIMTCRKGAFRSFVTDG